MPKWADYVVIAVSYNAAHARIARMKAKKDLGDTLAEKDEVFTTGQIADAIVKGTTFVSATGNKDGTWNLGADLAVVVKTVKDGKITDNLDELPEF